MAYLNGKWLARDERQREIDARIAMIAEFNRLADAGVITPYEIDQWETVDAELEKLQRVHRAEHDLLYFTYEYFSHECNPNNESNLIPEGQTLADAAEFHKTLCSLLDDVVTGKQRTNVGWSVGRRHAKTAYLSNSFLCHQVVFRHQKYIIEVSETTDVAGDFIKWTVNQLKFNEKLREDFGSLLHPKPSMNEVDNKYEFITSTGTKVEAKGIGTQMRGLRHLSERPGLFILDDLESGDNTNTPELRKKNLHWFRSEMLEALGFGGICIYMGTIVHYDSVLNHVLTQRKDFISRKFPAILSWSEREDLWEEWRKIYNADEPDAKEKADLFYEANKDEMLRGTEVLWPIYSYKFFMEKRESMGARAFNQEYLGNPVDEESQVFKPEDFTYFTESDIDADNFDYYCGIDFAMGKEKGDYSAIITVGKSPNGVFYVMDAFIERVHPDVLLETVVSKTIEYQYAGIAVEAQQAQEWFAHKLKEELRRRGYPSSTRVKEIKQRMRKSLRIESLLPDIQSGKIRFKKQHRLLLEMFELYPNHNWDDGPDALHMAVSAGMNGKRQLKKKPRWM
ncbi:phage terminase large subunit [Aneurinibacillus aneurinilyticus]|uniref:Phage terminase large subunit n=1 Tax=Aneurinibacillus aneurinilyticus TaxID=1391 RepID=A0A848CYK8_ANEAE|nr:phage terminase large subunit [Aneurinibacillus aneurinilyticus]NMF00012.1 phage terminase large subunit [Aneurinibacillus aneurinilyticus]